VIAGCNNLQVGYAVAGWPLKIPGPEAMCLRLLPDSIVTTAKKVPISVVCHPLGTRQMGFPRPARPLRLAGRINMQHEARHLGPVRTVGVGVQEA
jgi:hypothetical protein